MGLLLYFDRRPRSREELFGHGFVFAGLEEKKEFSDTKPEARTEGYYKKRPCVELVREAAAILEEYLLEKES